MRLAEQTPSSQLGATSEAFAQKVDRLVTLTLTLNLTLTLTLTLNSPSPWPSPRPSI